MSQVHKFFDFELIGPTSVFAHDGTVAFPDDLPPPWFGIILGSYGLTGTMLLLLSVMMVYLLFARRGILTAHPLVLYAGMIMLFVSLGIANWCRAIVLYHSMFHGGEVLWGPWLQIRAFAICIAALSSAWVVSATMQLIPFLTRYQSPRALSEELARLKERLHAYEAGQEHE